MRLFILQPAFMPYRRDFYNHLLRHFSEAFLVGEDRGIIKQLPVRITYYSTRNRKVFFNLIEWQSPTVFLKKLKKGDTLLMYANPRILSNLWIFLCARLKGANIVFWNQGRTGSSPYWRTRIRYMWQSLSDRNLLYYEEERELAIQMGAFSEKLYAAGNTVNTDSIQSARDQVSKEDLKSFIEKHELLDRKVILYIGRPTQKSGILVLLEAFVQVWEKDNSFLLVMIGVDDSIKRKYLNLQNSDLLLSIKTLGMINDESILAPWFLASSLFFYAGDVGLSLLHAFAYGLPALIHDDLFSHMPEASIFKEKEHGLFFKKGDPNDAAKKLIEMFERPEQLEKYGATARKVIYSNYRADQMAERVIKAVSF